VIYVSFAATYAALPCCAGMRALSLLSLMLAQRLRSGLPWASTACCGAIQSGFKKDKQEYTTVLVLWFDAPLILTSRLTVIVDVTPAGTPITSLPLLGRRAPLAPLCTRSLALLGHAPTQRRRRQRRSIAHPIRRRLSPAPPKTAAPPLPSTKPSVASPESSRQRPPPFFRGARYIDVSL